MSNKEFRRHLKQLVARQHTEEPPLVEKKPPKSEPTKPTAATEKKPPTMETRKFNRTAQSQVAGRHYILLSCQGAYGKISGENGTRRRLTNMGRFHAGWFSSHGGHAGRLVESLRFLGEVAMLLGAVRHQCIPGLFALPCHPLSLLECPSGVVSDYA